MCCVGAEPPTHGAPSNQNTHNTQPKVLTDAHDAEGRQVTWASHAAVLEGYIARVGAASARLAARSAALRERHCELGERVLALLRADLVRGTDELRALFECLLVAFVGVCSCLVAFLPTPQHTHKKHTP